MNTHIQRGKSAGQRFKEKTRHAGECIEWTSALGSRGYGVFYVSKERPAVFAHRYALEQKLGRPIADGLFAMHSCDNPKCVNPDHLSEGSNSENQMDASRKGRNARGERNGGGGKLTEAQVLEILRNRGVTSGPEEARRHSVSRHVVNAIRRRQLWRHVNG